jgi:RHS repeat-associated protein
VRGQLAEIRAGTTYTGPTDTNSDRGAIVNRYSLQSGCLGASCNATDNNGNLRRQDISIPNNGTFTQIYEYDSLNRLQSVRENKDGGATNWQQAYTYDRHGNRSIDQSGTTQGVGINSMQASVVQNTLTNRIYAPGETEQNHPLIDYDPAGNQRRDYYSDNSPRNIDYDSTYDAENRMKTSTATYSNPADTQTSTYTYDGDGRRVKRTVGNTETWQVYGLGGELLAEYAVNGSPSSPQKEYGYRNGQLLVEVTATTAGWGPPPVIDDNPLELNVTTVQSRHITQLRTAINALRTHMQMSNYNWAYSATTSDWISANPILEMRIALNQALGAPSTPYSAGLAYEEPIKAIHIQELRDRVLAAWMTGTGGVDFRWLVADQLGTPRIIIDKTGALANVTRHDYLPFGEELFADTGLRTTTQGYTSAGSIAADGSRQKFTSKERDNETGLDYFGARYYASTQGRFTSTDPLLSTGYPGSPQTWNRYSYTLNNPLRLIDPTGMFVIDPNLSTDDQDKIKAGYNQLKASLGNYKPGSSDYKRIQRALKTLGGIGVKNGITVTVGSTLNEGAGAQVVPTGIDYRGKKPVGLHATITIASGDFKSNTEAGIGEALGHEATHAADFKDLALAGVGVDKLWAAFDAIRYKSEFEAYMLSGAVRQALGPATAYEAPGNIPVSESNQLPWTLGKVSLWNPAWAVLDASKIQTQRSWAINSVLMTPKKQGGHYGLEPPKR